MQDGLSQNQGAHHQSSFLEYWRKIFVGAPLFGVALAALAGALWSEHEAWAFFCLLAAGLVIRPKVGWYFSLGLILFLAAYRAEVQDQKILHGREVLALTSGTKIYHGECVLGRLWKSTSTARIGIFRQDSGRATRVLVIGESERKAGDRVHGTMSFFLPPKARNPGERAWREGWENEGIVAAVRFHQVEKRGIDWKLYWLRAAESTRSWLRESVTRGLPENGASAAIIKAMMLGEKPVDRGDVTEVFRRSGAMHVFAVSGLHVTLVGALVWCVLMGTGLSRRWAIIFVILAMLSYAVVSGGRPPAMRACLMAVIFLGAFWVRRQPNLLNALAVAFLWVVLIRPSQIHNAGFQLSYGVLGAIAMLFSPCYRLTSQFAKVDPFFPRSLIQGGTRMFLSFREWIAGLLATSMAAWVGSLPFMWAHFGVVTPIGILASVILIPITFLILGVGFSGAIVGLLFPPLGTWVNQANHVLAHGAWKAAHICSQVPGGQISFQKGAPGDLIIFDLADGGAATFLGSGGGVLFDCGSARSFQTLVGPALNRWGENVDSIVCSHPDAFHTGGLLEVQKRFGIKQVLAPVKWARSESYRGFMESFAEAESFITIGQRNNIYRISPESTIEILREGREKEDRLADDRGMVIRLNWKGWRFLFLGDLDCQADVIIMGRHEYGYSGTRAFLDQVGAKAVIVSSANYPENERPPDRWRQSVRNTGCLLFCQDETGAVMISGDDKALTFKSFLTGEQIDIRKK